MLIKNPYKGTLMIDYEESQKNTFTRVKFACRARGLVTRGPTRAVTNPRGGRLARALVRSERNCGKVTARSLLKMISKFIEFDTSEQ